jgi:protein ImuA
LRDRIWALEQGNETPPPVLPIGAVDSALPWGGLPLARLHQVTLTGGLAPFGLTPDQVITAETERAVEILWAMEEGLRCPALGGVLGEIDDLPSTAARRMQLAAEAGGAAGLVVTPPRATAGGATTRWKVSATPSAPSPWGGLGAPAWHVALERCRNGLPRSWTLTWRDGRFALLDP